MKNEAINIKNATISAKHLPINKSFSGKEKQTVRDLGWLDFMARMYANCEMPIFTTQDPLAEKYYSISPYAYCGNNPVNRIDPNGMDWYYFDQNNGGNYYQKQEQEGKHRMVVRSEDENSITYTFYDFNDPDVDAKGIENGEITKMEFLSDEKVENMIDASGVKMSDARNSPLSYAWHEGGGTGKMDYAKKGNKAHQIYKIKCNISGIFSGIL